MGCHQVVVGLLGCLLHWLCCSLCREDRSGCRPFLWQQEEFPSWAPSWKQISPTWMSWHCLCDSIHHPSWLQEYLPAQGITHPSFMLKIVWATWARNSYGVTWRYLKASLLQKYLPVRSYHFLVLAISLCLLKSPFSGPNTSQVLPGKLVPKANLRVLFHGQRKEYSYHKDTP